MSECHFWADVMLRQSCLRASRVSPAQKLQGLRLFSSKNFSRATFLGDSVGRLVICPWNKFEEKAQCVVYNSIWCRITKYIPSILSIAEVKKKQEWKKTPFSVDMIIMFQIWFMTGKWQKLTEKKWSIRSSRAGCQYSGTGAGRSGGGSSQHLENDLIQISPPSF